MKDAVDQTALDCTNRTLEVVLEDDFLARVYYHLLRREFSTLAPKVFLKSRIFQDVRGQIRKNKYDIVIGSVREHEGAKHTQRDVQPEFIGEVKVFPMDFRYQQLRRRKISLIEDMAKLNAVDKIAKGIDFEYAVILFDAIGWLNEKNKGHDLSRIDEIQEGRDALNKRIRIIGIISGKAIER